MHIYYKIDFFFGKDQKIMQVFILFFNDAEYCHHIYKQQHFFEILAILLKTPQQNEDAYYILN